MIGNKWDIILKDLYKTHEYNLLIAKVKKLYQQQHVLPDKNKVFKALENTDYNDVKVVILGQDPYPNKEDAMGLAFSVNTDRRIPGSLKNIFKKLSEEYNINNKTGNLEPWTKQGVLLLNTILTVKEGLPLSHKNIGWQLLTDYIIIKLNERQKPIVFLLFGTNAHEKQKLITATQHLCIKTSHPSNLGYTKEGKDFISFQKAEIFKKTNNFLIKNNIKPINWNL
ncbi:MAG: uracil-DNA glycosylase [Tenericutes bacterium]|jgi:uracil-DNA glycosylase|nr:uracil-DNA glycosylase [Mycoplasmatota bacterium]